MQGKYLLFLSTNGRWGGSEILWTRCLPVLAKAGYRLGAGAYYDHQTIQEWLPAQAYFIDLSRRWIPPSFGKRVIGKLFRLKAMSQDNLLLAVNSNKPDLVIISQGNNTEGRQLMRDCIEWNLPFVTLTHLVTETSWPGLDDEIINELINSYSHALQNYFVSASTLIAHERLLASSLPGAVVVYNPFTKASPPGTVFPQLINGCYQVALLGRLENFHKGYDLLFEVLKQTKWKQRPVHFSIFGKGPHKEWMQRCMQTNQINNVSIHEHQEEITAIWSSHHILLMPSRMEGQSLTLIESMYFARPSIVTAVGGTTELVEDGINGFVAAYPTLESIDEAMERAWQQRDQWEQMGLNALQTIKTRHPQDATMFFCELLKNLPV